MHLGPMSKLQEVHEGKEGLFKFKSDCHLDKARTVTRSKGVPGPLLKCRGKAFLFLCTNQQGLNRPFWDWETGDWETGTSTFR